MTKLRSIFENLRSDYRLRYSRKRVDFEKCLNYYFIDNGIAYITCKVTGMNDVIDHYSVPGYEILNSDFTTHLERVMQFIPEKYPLVMELTGHHFTDEEKQTIEDAVWRQFELRLGIEEVKRRRNIIRIIWFGVFLFLSALLLRWVLREFGLFIREIGFIIFWFFGDRMIEFIVLDEPDIRLSKMQAAQILSMKIIFTDSYDDSDLSEKESEEIKKEIIENVEDEEI